MTLSQEKTDIIFCSKSPKIAQRRIWVFQDYDIHFHGLLSLSGGGKSIQQVASFKYTAILKL